jgi:hypothetical protein
MRTNAQEAVLSAYIASIAKRTPREAAQDAAELCRNANSLNRLNEIACNSALTERQERRKQNLQTRIKAVLEGAGLVLNLSLPKTSSGNHQKLFVLHARHLSEQSEGKRPATKN